MYRAVDSKDSTIDFHVSEDGPSFQKNGSSEKP